MDVVVECHSGYTYAERPKAFYQDQTRYVAETIEAEWRGPNGKHFRVNTKNGRVFELIYNQDNDDWQIQET